MTIKPAMTQGFEMTEGIQNAEVYQDNRKDYLLDDYLVAVFGGDFAGGFEYGYWDYDWRVFSGEDHKKRKGVHAFSAGYNFWGVHNYWRAFFYKYSERKRKYQWNG